MEFYTVRIIIISGGYGVYLYEVRLGNYVSHSITVNKALEGVLRKRLKHSIINM